MKALIFDPYLDTVGGGERYMMTVAKCLQKSGFEITLSWDNKKALEKIKERFNIDLKEISFTKKIPELSFLEKKKLTREFDLVFYLSDGSVPFLFGKKNILHFQAPFHGVSGSSLKNRIKFKNIDEVVCNSFFTKNVIDKEFSINSKVLYPPIAVEDFKKGRKENIILSVGRFSDLYQSKRQDVLIEAFKKANLKNYKLVLAGGTDVGKGKFFESLKRQQVKGKIEIIENPPFKELKKLYSKARIFWLASGFKVNEAVAPERVEHFGMTTVEAMAAGCVVVALKKGGQREIIDDGRDGFLWETEKDLIAKTKAIIKDSSKRDEIANNAIRRSKDFSREKFCQELLKLVK